MAVYIALLRGINVGGKNKIKMEELKLLFEALGLSRAETYIQSGNVIFESEKEEGILRDTIEQGIESKFGFPVAVILRTKEELKQIIMECPFTEKEIKNAEEVNQEGESMYVALMPKAPDSVKLDKLKVYEGEMDECRIKNREIYLLLRHSIRNSKLAGNLQKLVVPSTVRNWNTMYKLYTMTENRA